MSFRELTYNQEHLQLLDSYQGSLPHAQFMQSSRWAAFQKERGQRVALIADESKSVIFLAIRQEIFNRSYWYIPRFDIPEGLDEIIKDIDSHAMFIRADLVRCESGEFRNLKRTLDVQPSRTLVLPLQGPEEKILSQMHQKTRYNIRLSQKKNLTIRRGVEQLPQFHALLEETRKRDGFRLHSKAYYEAMILSGAVELRAAWQGNKMLAAGVFAYFGDTATYVHGASSSASRQLMAPYFLHWNAICEACSAGHQWYDWHGVDESKWPGVTRFKLGFGGEMLEYAGTFDKPLAPLAYAGYTILRRLRRLF